MSDSICGERGCAHGGTASWILFTADSREREMGRKSSTHLAHSWPLGAQDVERRMGGESIAAQPLPCPQPRRLPMLVGRAWCWWLRCSRAHLIRRGVQAALQPLPHSAQVHGVMDDLMVARHLHVHGVARSHTFEWLCMRSGCWGWLGRKGAGRGIPTLGPSCPCSATLRSSQLHLGLACCKACTLKEALSAHGLQKPCTRPTLHQAYPGKESPLTSRGTGCRNSEAAPRALISRSTLYAASRHSKPAPRAAATCSGPSPHARSCECTVRLRGVFLIRSELGALCVGRSPPANIFAKTAPYAARPSESTHQRAHSPNLSSNPCCSP